jgi:heavy metal translocating P-type ATPase
MSTVRSLASKDANRASNISEQALQAVEEQPPSTGAELGVVDGEVNLRFEIRHEIQGRLRFYCAALRDEPKIAHRVKERLFAVSGIEAVRVNSWCAGLVVTYSDLTISKEEVLLIVASLKLTIEDLSFELPVPAKESRSLSPLQQILLPALSLIESWFPAVVQCAFGAAALASAIFMAPLPLTRMLLAFSVLPIGLRASRTVLDESRLGVDALDGIAAVLMAANGKLVEACFMTALISVGEYIRDATARKCQKIVDDLLGLSGRFAWLVKGKQRICIRADEVRVGDVVVIYPGELVPVDGIVTQGLASIDQAKLTGEAMPVEVCQGDEVLAATVVLEGKIYVSCQSIGIDTKAGAMLEAVQAAPLHETKMQNYASVMADRLVVPILLSAGACFAVTGSLVRLMSMLIFDFSTGIRIAAPTAVLASMHRAGRRGILIKSGAALERLSKVDAVVFDKTGTLTLGEPRVTRVELLGDYGLDQIVTLSAAVEQRLHHPASRAIIKYAAQRQLAIPERSESAQVRGMGAKARVEGDAVLVGSRRLMESEAIDLKNAAQAEAEISLHGESLAYVAINGKLAALIAYSDQIRLEAAQTVAELKKLGVTKLVMATGDGENVARIIAGASGITDISARAFPEQKAELVKQLRASGYTVAVIGDGINDSPALAHADVALSLHGGTEAARAGADIVLTDGDLRRLPEAIKIARSAMKLVQQNLSLAMLPNSSGLALAALGIVGPAGATLLNNGSAIAAALNSLRPLYSDSWSTD